jgi:hypothetical protein
MFGGRKRPGAPGFAINVEAPASDEALKVVCPPGPKKIPPPLLTMVEFPALEVISNSVLPAEPNSPIPPLLLIVALPALPKIFVSPPETTPPSLLMVALPPVAAVPIIVSPAAAAKRSHSRAQGSSSKKR